MLDIAMHILDKLIDLTKLRSDKRKAVFTNHIEPIFEMVKAVYTDYQDMLNDVEEAIDAGKSRNELVELVKKRRRLEERTRIELEKYTEHFLYWKPEDDELHDFAFWSHMLIAGDPAALGRRIFTTQATSLINDLTMMAPDGQPFYKPSIIVGRYQNDLRYSYKRVSDAYYQLKIKLLA